MTQKRFTYEEAIIHCDATVVQAGKELANEIKSDKRFQQSNTYV